MQGLHRKAHLLPGEFEIGYESLPDATYALAEQMFGLDAGEIHALHAYGITLEKVIEDPFQAIRDLHQEIEELGGTVPPSATGLLVLTGIFVGILESALYKLERIPLSMH